MAYVPAGEPKSRILYLHDEGMLAREAPEKLVKQGHLVLVAELSGMGGTEAGQDQRSWGAGRFGWDNQEVFIAYLMGDSFVRMRVEDALMWAAYFGSKSYQVTGVGEAAIPALHAAALYRERVSSLTLSGMIRSWEEVVQQPEHHNQLVNAVHGVLRHYDLPDLIELTGATVTDSVDVDWKASPSK